MSKESDFLLGQAFGLITLARNYLIDNEQVACLRLVEDEYQKLSNAIEKHYYCYRKKDEINEPSQGK